MQSGELRHRIRFEAETRVDDDHGGFTRSWTTVVSATFGALWPVKGQELMEGGRTVAVGTHRLRIRYRKPFSSQWRVRDLFNGSYWAIVSRPIDVGDKHVWLEMFVTETDP